MFDETQLPNSKKMRFGIEYYYLSLCLLRGFTTLIHIEDIKTSRGQTRFVSSPLKCPCEPFPRKDAYPIFFTEL